MSKRVKTSPTHKSMAVPRPLNKIINAGASSKPHGNSSGRKNKAARRSLSKAEFSSAAIKRSLSLLLPFSFFLFLGLLLIWERVKVNELAAQTSKLDMQRLQLMDQNGKLRIQLEQLSGYGRISRIATQRLRLIQVPQQTILVEEE